MGKTVEFLALASLLFVFVCSLAFPRNSIMWLATLSSTFTVLRIVLITLLATLLITTSFLDHHLHGLLGLFAASLSLWALYSTYNNHLQLLDSLSFLAAGVSLSIEALQPSLQPVDKESFGAKPWRTEARQRFAGIALGGYTLARGMTFKHPLDDTDSVAAINQSHKRTAAV